MNNKGIKMKLTERKICRLFIGGSCPFCDNDYEIVGISYEEAQQINKQCCKSSYIPDVKELEEMKNVKNS